MTVLSLFDGMSCGVLAMMESGVEIDRYVAYEIDKYAIQTSQHNFPFIEQRGDVFKADFTEFEGFDWLIGGSPCTYWSIAQTNNRETTASGMGWELFSQYVRALHEAKPKYFIYENNKSMSKDIRRSIDEAFGFEAVLINSALVSAQNRQRLYWVGRRNDDGTYSKVDVPQPQDRGILLKDVLEDGCCVDKDKAYCLKHQAGNARDYFKKHHTQIKYEPINVTVNGKSQTLKASPSSAISSMFRNGTFTEQVVWQSNVRASQYLLSGTRKEDPPRREAVQTERYTQYTNGITGVAEPVRVGALPRPNGELSKSQSMQIYSVDGKSATQCACGGGLGAKTGLYAVPVNTTVDGKSQTIKAQYYKNGMANFLNDTSKGCLVKDGKITIKGKEYPIKLPDGFYIIRKLTVRECMRLQTVPEWYEFPVSDSQAYKMLGNGWTVMVISWLIDCTLR